MSGVWTKGICKKDNVVVMQPSGKEPLSWVTWPAVSSLRCFKICAVLVIALSAAAVPAQRSQAADIKTFQGLLSKIRKRAESGVAVTYRRVDDSASHRSIARYSMMGPNQRLDEVVYEIRDGKETTLFATTHIQRDQVNGSKIHESGIYQDVEGLLAQEVLDSFNTERQPRLMRSGGSKDILFSHLAWRYGRASDGWISESILRGKNVEVNMAGQNYRLTFDRGVGVRSHITIENSANPRIIKRSGRPNSESVTPLLGFDLFETGDKTMAFTRTSDYSKFPEHVLQREDTPDHKIPRGRDEGRTDYTILSEEFAPLEESLFDLKLISKNGASARQQAARASLLAGANGDKPASSVSGLLWVRRIFILVCFLAAGILYVWSRRSAKRR